MKALAEMSDDELADVKQQTHLAYIHAWIKSATIEELRELIGRIEKRQAELMDQSHEDPDAEA